MPAFAGNSGFFRWNDINMCPYWMGDLSVSDSAAEIDTTGGCDVEYATKAAGVKTLTVSFSVMYVDPILGPDTIDTYKAALQSGAIATLVLGPEGLTENKPKLQGSFMLSSVSMSGKNSNGGAVSFALTFSAADAPTSTITGDLAGTFDATDVSTWGS